MKFTSYWQIYNILKELYITSFKWSNLPPSINPRFLELCLFDNGKVAFFYEDTLEEFHTLRCSNEGVLDIYGEPQNIRITGNNGAFQTTRRNNKNAVIIYNNFLRDTPHHRILDYSKRIYRMERTIDVNIHAQRTPLLFQTSKKLELTIKNILKKYDEYEPLIVVDENLDLNNAVKVLKTESPFIADKLEEQKRRLWNECLSFIGIENNSAEKNERLVKNEVLISNGLAIASRNSRQQARETAITKIKEIFASFELFDLSQITVEANNPSLLDVIDNNAIEEVDIDE